MVNHYFPKAKVAEIKVQAGSLQIGDQLTINGPTTGVVKAEVKMIMKDNKAIDKADKTDTVTIPLDQIVRDNDKVYLIKALVR